MFLLILTRFVPLSRDLPMLEGLFLTLTLLLCLMALPISIVEWRAKKEIDKQNAKKKELE